MTLKYILKGLKKLAELRLVTKKWKKVTGKQLGRLFAAIFPNHDFPNKYCTNLAVDETLSIRI